MVSGVCEHYVILILLNIEMKILKFVSEVMCMFGAQSRQNGRRDRDGTWKRARLWSGIIHTLTFIPNMFPSVNFRITRVKPLVESSNTMLPVIFP